MEEVGGSLGDPPAPSLSPGASPDFQVPEASGMKIFLQDPEELLKPWKMNPAFVAIVSTHAFTFIFGTVGNGLVVAAMGGKGRPRSVTSAFLVSLALADLLLLLFCVPMETLQYFVNVWGSSLCKLASYVEVVSAASSVLNLSAITLERYIVIVYPMRSRSFCTMSNCRRAIVVVWIFAFLLAGPVIVTKGSYSIEYYNNHTTITLYYCNDADGNGTRRGFIVAVYLLVSLLIIPFTLMVFCYARVIKELWISTKNMAAMTRICSSTVAAGEDMESIASGRSRKTTGEPERQSLRTRTKGGRVSLNGRSNSSNDVKQARKQVIQMLILVVILFLACWGPRFVMDAIIKHGLTEFQPLHYNLRVAFHLLPFLHSCLNPIIYSVMSSSLRSTMVHSCSKWKCLSCLLAICCQDAVRSNRLRGAVASSFTDARRLKSSVSTRSSMVTEGALTSATATTVIQLQSIPVENCEQSVANGSGAMTPL